MESLKKEIEKFLKETYHSRNCVPRENIVTERLLYLFKKRIDLEIKPPNDMEYHCYAAFNYATEKVKELLK